MPRTNQELDELHERSGLNARFYKKESSKASIQSNLKSNSKKAKRRRYEADPETLSEQIARRAQTKQRADSDEDEDEEGSDEEQQDDDQEADQNKGGMDGLRQRLQARIDLLRKQRETDGKRGFKRNKAPPATSPSKACKRCSTDWVLSQPTKVWIHRTSRQ